MAITEEKGLEILGTLLKREDVPTNSIPETYKGILDAHNAAFPAPAPEPVVQKKKRRKGVSGSGWPVGVSRAAHTAWKAEQEAKGVDPETLTPHAFRDIVNAQKKAERVENEAKAPAKAKTEVKAAEKKAPAKAADTKATETKAAAPAKAAETKAPAKAEVKDVTATKGEVKQADTKPASMTKEDPKMTPIGAI